MPSLMLLRAVASSARDQIIRQVSDQTLPVLAKPSDASVLPGHLSLGFVRDTAARILAQLDELGLRDVDTTQSLDLVLDSSTCKRQPNAWPTAWSDLAVQRHHAAVEDGKPMPSPWLARLDDLGLRDVHTTQPLDRLKEELEHRAASAKRQAIGLGSPMHSPEVLRYHARVAEG